jgi:hypothetical protein
MALPSIEAQRRGRRGWSGKNAVLGGFRNAGAKPCWYLPDLFHQ